VKVGDLVKYTGSWGSATDEPMAIVVEAQTDDTNSTFHHKIRVLWVDEVVPIQGTTFSVNKKSRLTTWISPKYFTLVSESLQ